MSAETRRSGRIPKQVAILLIGSDIEGRMFSERTKTVVLSRHGAGIVSGYKLSAEQEVVIRSEESNKEAEVRVVGQIGTAGDTYIYGVAFLGSHNNFWDIEFPPLSEAEKRASHTVLECGSCHARESADHSDLESDVYAINESIMRYCKNCGSSTLWRQPMGQQDAAMGEQGVTTPQSPAAAKPDAWQPHASREQTPEHLGAFGGSNVEVPASAPLGKTAGERRANAVAVSELEPVIDSSKPSVTPQADKGQQVHSKDADNRRKYGRARVSFKACIRRADGIEDVVACEDMSRGGIRFKSAKQYFEKTLIQVAVPYSPETEAIFVAGQIAWVMELPEQKMWRCGVAYLRGGKRD